MPGEPSTYFSLAVEGDLDATVAARIVALAGGAVHNVYGKRGKNLLRRSVVGYNEAAKFSPWLFLVDLDHDFDCAPLLRKEWIPEIAPLMAFRVAIREVESWLMADSETLAEFLGVARARIPADVENLADPKRALVDIASRSRIKKIRDDIVPRPGSGRETGRAYSSRMIQYAETVWRPKVAAEYSSSLAACKMRVSEMCGS